MTESFDEYGDLLRRALHAEADQVMPSTDGLERIRSRTGGKAPGGWAAWFTASWTRPLIAVGAAMVLALLAVSAPPAINHLTSLTSHQGSAPHHTGNSPAAGTSSGGRTDAVPPGQFPKQDSEPALPPLSGGPGSQSLPCPVTQTPENSQSPGTRKTPTPSPSPSGRPDHTPSRLPGASACPTSAQPPSGRPSTAPGSGSPTPSAPAQGSPPAAQQQGITQQRITQQQGTN